jgi:hypothetical protein
MEDFKQFNLPKSAYPITIRMLRSDNRFVVWKKVIDLPNEGPIPLYIPPMAKQTGVPIIIQVEYANGETTETAP